MKFDRDRFRRLFQYVVWKANDASSLDPIDLNNILWLSDARAFVSSGRPITGETYIRRKQGPMSRHFREVRDELMAENAIRYRPGAEGSREEGSFAATRRPGMQGFTAEELRIVDDTARLVTEGREAAGPGTFGWEIAEVGEPLPYHAAMVDGIRKPRADELEWAREVASRRRLP
jgi:hypothetical protein